MFCRISFFALLLFFTRDGSAQQQTIKPVPIIFDSDIGPDYDDVGAITILHVLEDRGEARILGTIASNKYEGIAAILDVFNTYFNRPDIPIGVPKEKAVDMRDSQHWTDSLLARYPHKIQRNDEVPDAVSLYRKILAAELDTSVTIVTVGFFTNLANLINSKGDSISSLTGKELIEKKVKLLVSMAGKFPTGKEFNVSNDAKASEDALANWPTKVIFSGFEIGLNIKTGLPLTKNKKVKNSPTKDAFSISLPQSPQDVEGRMSWDESAVLIAVRGYEPYYTLQPGRIKVASNGANSWDKNGKGQFYLVEKESPKVVQDVINQLMMEEPKNK